MNADSISNTREPNHGDSTPTNIDMRWEETRTRCNVIMRGESATMETVSTLESNSIYAQMTELCRRTAVFRLINECVRPKMEAPPIRNALVKSYFEVAVPWIAIAIRKLSDPTEKRDARSVYSIPTLLDQIDSYCRVDHQACRAGVPFAPEYLATDELTRTLITRHSPPNGENWIRRRHGGTLAVSWPALRELRLLMDSKEKSVRYIVNKHFSHASSEASRRASEPIQVTFDHLFDTVDTLVGIVSFLDYAVLSASTTIWSCVVPDVDWVRDIANQITKDEPTNDIIRFRQSLVDGLKRHETDPCSILRSIPSG